MQIHDTAFIAPSAVVLGNVTIGENSGIWYNAVVRGDRDSIVIGRESNIQDNAVVHLGSGYPVEIGDHVTIGHGAIIHGCKIGDNTMIGGGDLEEETHRLAEELGVTDVITFPGFQGPEEVRAAMEKSEIYLVTSDRKEGWGAVVNEAMNSGCAVVADHMIGAAPWLIRQGENGRMYRDGEEQELFQTVERLLRDPGECRRLGKNAQQTIVGEWNARTAAERLIEQ